MMNTPTLLSLPLEDVLFPHVFCYFHPLELWRLRLVSKLFYNIIYQYYNTTCVELIIDHETLHNYILSADVNVLVVASHILSNSPKLKKLTFRGPFSGVSCTAEHCLQSLCTLTPHLTQLDLLSIELSNALSVTFRDCCKFLEKLRLFSITCFNSLDVLLKDCTTLKEVHFDKDYTSHSQLTDILLQQEHLEVFEFVGHNSKDPPFQLERILLSLPCLCSISLSYSSWLTDRSLQMIAEYCHQLKYIEIFHCQQITWKGLESLHKKGICVKSSIQHTQPVVVVGKNQI